MNFVIRPIKPEEPKTEKEILLEQTKEFEKNIDNQEPNNTQ